LAVTPALFCSQACRAFPPVPLSRANKYTAGVYSDGENIANGTLEAVDGAGDIRGDVQGRRRHRS
jgi:hypothetical protein